jgi:hypothetical protein
MTLSDLFLSGIFAVGGVSPSQGLEFFRNLSFYQTRAFCSGLNLLPPCSRTAVDFYDVKLHKIHPWILFDSAGDAWKKMRGCTGVRT